MVCCRLFMGLIAGTYCFDQFSVKLDLPTYTDEEYDQFLQGITNFSIVLMEIPNGRRKRPIIYGRCALISTYDGLSLQIDMSGRAKNEPWRI